MTAATATVATTPGQAARLALIHADTDNPITLSPLPGGLLKVTEHEDGEEYSSILDLDGVPVDRATGDGAQVHFDSEAEAVAYFAERFVGEGPAEIARYVELLQADMVEQGENPDLWWDGIAAGELVTYLFGLI